MLTFSSPYQALEDGEDLQELKEKTREKKERRATNKLIKDAEVSNRGTPASDTESRGRRGRKAKGKASDEPAAGSKRKRGAMKSMSVTPSVADDDDDDERDQVCPLYFYCGSHNQCRQKRRKTKMPEINPAIREKMKKAFNDCYKAVLACEAEEGRKRCELFREVPDKRVRSVDCRLTTRY